MKKVSLSRIYSFSAAHRLHALGLSEEENQRLYGKCHNAYGHGHDYFLEVTVQDQPDPQTGMIVSLSQMDGWVQDLLKKLDHKHLNNEIEYFKERPSTGEVIIQFLWDELQQRIPGGKLYYLKLWETKNNYFELGKETI